MADELTYALITPYSLLKSRTGGILGRLLSLTNLEIIGATMFAPSDSFVDKYCATIEEQDINLGGAATGATIELPDQPRLFDPENLDQTTLDI